MKLPRFPRLRKFNIPRFNFPFKRKSNNYLDNYPNIYSGSNYLKRYKDNSWDSYYSKKQSKRPFKTLCRVAVALAIFLVVLTLRETNHPVGIQAREGLKYMLTTDWDYRPALDKAVQLGLQAVNIDIPFFNDVPGTSPVLAPPSDAGQYAIPVSGRVVRQYGWIKDSDGLEVFNSGIFISCREGTEVRAARSGKVARLGEEKDLGNYVLIDHGNGDFTMYAGLGEIHVTEGQEIQQEMPIGTVAGGKEPGLHFEIRENHKLVDPLIKLQVFSPGGDMVA
ncbi:murein hydrolase activator EnvC family protein [Desulfofalx alkaliphila]|uniref:murein hydrolase activator EnvC family protein n=1 Tax=Desulfofalx alkaliphila TaxID=105483 RepID=UPI00068BA682|nr:M23 family metallopeptidase [Desulfofalx alkaliphila]